MRSSWALSHPVGRDEDVRRGPITVLVRAAAVLGQQVIRVRRRYLPAMIAQPPPNICALLGVPQFMQIRCVEIAQPDGRGLNSPRLFPVALDALRIEDVV